MKKELEPSKRKSQELCAYLRLWKGKGDSLGREINRSKVEMEFLQNQITRTVSESSSTFVSKSKWIRHLKEVREISSNEMVEKEVPTGVQ